MTIVSICCMIYSFGFSCISLLTEQTYSAALQDYHGTNSLWDLYNFILSFLLSVQNAFACWFFIQLETKLRLPQQSWFLRACIGNRYCSCNKFPEYRILIKPRMLFPVINLAADFKFSFHITVFLLFNQR